MNPVPGLDASFDRLTDAEAAALVAEGERVYAQCLWTGVEQPPYRVINLRAASQAGLTIIGYTSLTHGPSGSYHVNMGLSGIPSDLLKQLARVAVDVELAGLTAGDVNSALDAVQNFGRPRDVYTSFGQWISMGNPIVNAYLWDANWDSDPTLSQKRAYGQWLGLIGKQWQGQHTDASGLTCDSNTFDLSIIQPQPAPPTPVPPTPNPPPGPTKTHQIDVMSDGSINVT